MGDEYTKTVRIRRPARVSSDGGRNVWTHTIETAELELVSTTQLEVILRSGDEASRGAIREVLSGKEEGVLARDLATGLFEIVSEDDLKAVLGDDETLPIRRKPAAAADTPGKNPSPKDESAQELSLVSTQMLRRLVPPAGKPAKPPSGVKPKAVKDRSGGFDPYNSG